MKNIIILSTTIVLMGVFANPTIANTDAEKERLIQMTPEAQKALDRNEGKLEGKSDKDKIICRKVARTGSRIGRRVCFTAAEEKQRRKDDKHALSATRQTDFSSSQPTAQ